MGECPSLKSWIVLETKKFKLKYMNFLLNFYETESIFFVIFHFSFKGTVKRFNLSATCYERRALVFPNFVTFGLGKIQIKMVKS